MPESLRPLPTPHCPSGLEYLEAQERLALAEEAFGPARLQAQCVLGIPQGLRVTLQLLIAEGAVAKEPGGRDRGQAGALPPGEPRLQPLTVASVASSKICVTVSAWDFPKHIPGRARFSLRHPWGSGLEAETGPSSPPKIHQMLSPKPPRPGTGEGHGSPAFSFPQGPRCGGSGDHLAVQ